MSVPPIDARVLAQSGAAALRRGDARAARESFERIVAAGGADAASCLGLAYACRRLGDTAAALAAVDKALAVEPRNLQALILKADCLADIGDARGASSFYGFAVRIAPPADQMPAELRGELGRAQAMCERYAGEFGAFLEDQLVRRGLVEGRSAARFRHSLDILLGRKKIYFQQPHTYFFPELPQIQFYDRNDFPWLDKVEAATADIRAELMEVLKEGSGFRPYIQGDPRRPRKEQSEMTDNPDWGAFYFWKDGEIVPKNAARCPRTMTVMEEVPLARVKNRSPAVLFSLLRPGRPDSTPLGACQYPPDLPPAAHYPAGLRVPCRQRHAHAGRRQGLVFDDTIEHGAWNRSNRTRVILLIEIWRPELTEEERGLVAAMFEAIDAYSGEKPAWSI